ncbi:MAG: NAD(P)/FAD-dependent oxidoreductase [Desulfarculaceae bacterium]|nr:NAD(P)/FAD-dependent oxidoreductase [Desulfarculaceae bacterium]MCF8074183.1 NAD(P)/FAD-dependent oxidoreductase [Desulfarculaceae bacterium]MCF8102764.1 NAD(P)/FAD-dependent oxidoreductase [Desulfarculaceae bacterium]MCF8116381.1 NAD(P)/FAD-dependent oxidoreductase [Desulfarculaceae bacterium]
MSTFDYDLLIIGGGGSAGFTAATTAMKSGAKVAMVESGRLGGLCILAGCMPSKTLLHSAAEVSRLRVDGMAAYGEIHQYTRGVVDYLATGRSEAVKTKQAKGLKVIEGRACLSGPHEVMVGGRAISAQSIVIATGSVEQVPPVPGLAESGYLDSDAFMRLEALPSSLIVLGGGTQAVELAQFSARMGLEVTVVQRSDHLISDEDPRVGQLIAESLEADGATVLTGTELKQVRRQDGRVTAEFEQGGRARSVTAEALLLSLGRVANTEGLGLAEAGVELGPKGQVVVDRHMRSSLAGIFAAGDVTGGPMVVNLAIQQGKAAGYNASHDQPEEVEDQVLPRAIFSDPQFARVGLNHAEAHAGGLDFIEASEDLGEMAVARTYPRPVKGFLTLRALRRGGRLIGAELVAPEASLMIHDMAVALKLGGTAADIAAIPYIHPCLSEAGEFAAGRLARQVEP